ncbi:putative CBP80/20-dependent translation initiation factor [Triplophysa rosa]|uniref:CBP80/20-dependent translation initiation factor n=1 Tax=Triplophysa rosa TaxID=992332 RepID=A0A9W7TE03_TRIRA|nr:putative CBP80/20-dependent translation initiation factor [Triplophysa rosa]
MYVFTVFPQLQNDADIAHAKKLFRRRRTDRRRQQRPPGGGGGGGVKSQNPLQQQGLQQQQPPNQTQQQPNADHQSGVGTKHGGWGYQGQQNQGGRQGGPHHGYSQNRRWHQHPKHQTNNFSQGADRTPTRNAKETENAKQDEPGPGIERAVKDEPVREQRLKNENDGKTEAGKISLLQSSKERLRKRLKEKEDVPVATAGPQQNRMDRLLEILNSMRNNRSGVEAQLTAFMEEAQSSADSEETLNEIVHTIYHKAVSDRSFAATAAKLCDKMALFMVEGTKFRSLLLNMLQRDFTRRDELRRTDVESWLGFVTLLCEVFGTMRSSAGEPFRVLVCPIYSCLRELLQSPDVKEDAVLCCTMELQSTGRLLEDQLPEMMTELLATVRDKMLCPSESQLTRSLLMEVVELHAHRWSPLEALTTAYYNRTIQKLTA